MNKKDEFNPFLPEKPLNEDKLSIEIPAEQSPIHPDRVPSGYEPMGEIELRGRVSRGLVSGHAPWWVLISGWVFLGGFALLALVIAIQFSFIGAVIFLLVAIIPFILLLRGTTAKLTRRKRRRR